MSQLFRVTVDDNERITDINPDDDSDEECESDVTIAQEPWVRVRR